MPTKQIQIFIAPLRIDSLKSVFDVRRRKPSFGALTAIVARSMGQNLYSATKGHKAIYLRRC